MISFLFWVLLCTVLLTLFCMFILSLSSKNAEETSQKENKYTKFIIIGCFIVSLIFWSFVSSVDSNKNTNHSTSTYHSNTQTHTKKNSSSSYHSSSSSNSYDDGYDDYYENGDYDQSRYDNDSSYRDGVDDAIDDE